MFNLSSYCLRIAFLYLYAELMKSVVNKKIFNNLMIKNNKKCRKVETEYV
jgi:hypothetical protein